MKHREESWQYDAQWVFLTNFKAPCFTYLSPFPTSPQFNYFAPHQTFCFPSTATTITTFLLCSLHFHHYIIGHFRVPLGLRFKTRVGAQPLIWKSFFILMQIKLIFTRKVVHLASFWKREFLELGSALLDSIAFYSWITTGGFNFIGVHAFLRKLMRFLDKKGVQPFPTILLVKDCTMI